MDAFKQKPVPRDFVENEIKFKKSNPVKVVDSIKKDYNREHVLQKIKEYKEGFVKSIGIKEKTNVLSKSIPGKKVAKKVSKKLKLKTVKSTITQVEPPKSKTARLTEQVDKDSQDKSVLIKGSLIDLKRLPIEETIKLSANNYYMNNRTIFTQFINRLFEDYKEQLEKESLSVDCQKDEDFTLLTHQKIVRDYINLYTPYRGLLLYHGLGSGKTCSSIAIAEGLKSTRTIMVMTPASLRSNYIKELKFCGDKIYKKKQYWEFIKTSDENMIKTLAEVLSLKEDFIRRHGGCWLVDVRKEPNFEELSSGEKQILDEQLDTMILSKYKFINYNGLRMKTLDEETNNGTINLFDNKVVIIDEAHNFVSRIVNKLKQPTSLAMRLYEYLLRAQNCRVVLLTGTPIINYPNELGILFNILRGYITTWTIPIITSSKTKLKKVDTSSLKNVLDTSNQLKDIIDFVDYTANRRELTFTRNPFGFSNVYTPKYKGVTVMNDENISNARMLDEIESVLKKQNIDINRGLINVEANKSLPDNLDTFRSMFINKDNTVKYKKLFQRRIIGLTSYFPDLTQLMPRFNQFTDIHVVKIVMSNYQLSVYEEARQEERKSAKNQAKKTGKKNDLYSNTNSTYRIFSRAYCNFVFPKGKRPKPSKEISEEELDKLKIDSDNSVKLDISYQQLLNDALSYLKNNASMLLTPTGENGEEGLQKYSPKFLHILENIQDEKYSGLHLVYSQFRTLEGIGIFKLVLEQNGFKEFKLMRGVNGLWSCNYENDQSKYFGLYTGTEDEEEKELLRNIYNGDWDTIPTNIKDQLEQVAKNNNMGEIIKVLMITASGAEGISLRNTRFVHIMEPYWHPVRMEQVIGRARRICSHKDLPIELQTVEVFLYLMTISDKQLEENASKELKLKDKNSELRRVTTSDEELYEISMKKARINQNLLSAIKEASMDCLLHTSSGNPLKCYTVADPSANKFTYKPNINKESSYKSDKLNVEKIELKGKEIEVPDPSGKIHVYAWNEVDNKVYTVESFKGALEGTRPLDLVGEMYMLEDGSYKFIPLGI